jgi:NAD(P)-dependent dehydrogenase (short-subunit alcohol dehydrogenase family)
MSAQPLAGRKALVTGGSRGIGRAIARRLVEEGAAVTITGRDAEAIARTAQELGCAGRAADATDAAAMEAVFAAVGEIDILVNNAGAALSKPFLKHDAEDWDATLRVNLTSAFLGCRLVLPGMMARRWGRIVNVASTAGLKGYAYTAAYCAAKHGLVGLTRALAVETARSGVTVNAVCPGFTDTDLTARAVATIAAETGRSAEDARAALERLSPQNRLVTPDEVAEAVAFLCRPSSLGLTGQSLIIAGGEVM